jgi:hypothetical protein
MMADEPISLEFLARQQERILDQLSSFRDDMQVLTAMVMRLDGTVGLVLKGLSRDAFAAPAARQPCRARRSGSPAAPRVTR